MKAVRWMFPALGALCAAAALVACGGGSSSTSGATTGGSAQAVTASGVVTAFGSVIVNGVEYATGAGTVVVDGDNDDAASTMSAVQAGMAVDVASSGTTAPTATFLRIRSAVRGEVDVAPGTTGGSMTVLGQNVVLTSGTSFAGANAAGTVTGPSNIAAGDYLKVYGYLEQCATTSAACPSGGDQIVATLVLASTNRDIYRAEGYVTGVGTSAGSFSVNGLTVTTTSTGTSPTRCVPSGCAVASGNFVEVRATTAPTGTGTPTLAASLVRVTTQSPAFATGATVRLGGVVSQFDATAATFVLRGILVQASASSLASTVATLADNQIVDVTGTVNADGSITATSITTEQFATFVLMGSLGSATAAGSSASSSSSGTTSTATGGTLVVLGQTFTVTGQTRFVDWAKGARPFNASNFALVLGAGDQVLVSGYPGTGGALTATRVERIPTPTQPVAGIQGLVSSDSASGQTLTIASLSTLGIAVNSSTNYFYPGAHGAGTESGFFAAIVANGSVATVIGTPSTATSGSTTTSTITAADAAVFGDQDGWAGGRH